MCRVVGGCLREERFRASRTVQNGNVELSLYGSVETSWPHAFVLVRYDRVTQA